MALFESDEFLGVDSDRKHMRQEGMAPGNNRDGKPLSEDLRDTGHHILCKGVHSLLACKAEKLESSTV